ncbi:tRNA pseudouridine(13) synthase TruD [Candidatus Woesearchaeota archaeon]|nr:tRNA pseudouridine(13) synthase TruD [Candidatus Woesearchaeota archaeon]
MKEEYKIKELPEDFVVKEKSSLKLADKGEYAVFRLKKRDYTTEKAVQQIADSLGIERKRIGYAGSKDSKAITEQSISIRNVRKEKVEDLKLKDIELEFLGCTNNPISLGDLEGNSFEIIIRNITEKPKKISRIVNYFGEQRFSRNNAEIGKAIITNDFKKAVDRILESIGESEKKMIAHLESNKNDFVGALKLIPWKTLNMYIHAYQSKLWNETARILLEKAPPALEALKKNSSSAFKIPLIGFSTETDNNEIKMIIHDILKAEGITYNDFVIRAIPELSGAGGERDLFTQVKDLVIGELEDDEINKGKKKVKIFFSLGKGSYATEVIKELFSV